MIKAQAVQIAANKHILEGILSIPTKATGIVLFAHGSGSSRFSPRNQFVAHEINKTGLATLLFDLLTTAEEAVDLYSREHRFNIRLLTERLVGATHWVRDYRATKHLNIGYFGSSTGAAAALRAAAKMKDNVHAVVSRGGRPDLTGPEIIQIQAPTLLIVGGLDEMVITLNEEALRQLDCPKELSIIPGATHLFEEPGTLKTVAQQAAHWFVNHLEEQENHYK